MDVRQFVYGTTNALSPNVADRDVLAAWNAYVAQNTGRGVILIGHSQGAFMLRKLIREQIDPQPRVPTAVVVRQQLARHRLPRRGFADRTALRGGLHRPRRHQRRRRCRRHHRPQCAVSDGNPCRVPRSYGVSRGQPVNEIPLFDSHVIDVNVGPDRLVDIASRQAESWLADTR
ncbi:DUF3089 domain-containing protein [Gordonia sp. ABSL11-1]|uniref:DUF3089 domain-containing protein n=1 Tax=Gordonia sp. ABSL11-1 TaxID=3053924 RepID=UPI002572C573|nr:DUF3089 domain-containing protein [Gordonia sp. ABSL11-1]MDL9947370.1 DUF3089 domain-containing protein [Gordonia sp. ABSL11-1]